jgi:protein TonB
MNDLPNTPVSARGQAIADTYREPLSPVLKWALAALVLFFHVGGGWALTQVEPVKILVGDVAEMEVRMVAAEPAAAPPDLPLDEAPPPPEFDPVVVPDPPLAEPPPPLDLKLPDLATAVEPPPPDLPPPAFPLEAEPPKPPEPKQAEPPKPKPPTPKPPKPKPPPMPAHKAPPAPHPAAQAPPRQAAPAAPGPSAPAAPRTVSAAQLGYIVAPNPVYPARARRAGEQGKVTVRVLVDVAGRPSHVSLQASSGHPALDESAMSAVRAAQFRPYSERGVPQPVWVLIPINFVLR